MSDDYAYLPPTLAEISQIAGLPAALALMREKYGRKVYFPRRAPDGHWLVQCVGREAADRLGDHYGNSRIEIPLGDVAFYKRAAARAAGMLESGASEAEVCRALGVHTRTARRYRARLRDASQGSLF